MNFEKGGRFANPVDDPENDASSDRDSGPMLDIGTDSADFRNRETDGTQDDAKPIERLLKRAVDLMTIPGGSVSDLQEEWNRLRAAGFEPNREQESLFWNLARGIQGHTFDLAAVQEILGIADAEDPDTETNELDDTTASERDALSHGFLGNRVHDSENESDITEGLLLALSRIQLTNRSSAEPAQSWHPSTRQTLQELSPSVVQQDRQPQPQPHHPRFAARPHLGPTPSDKLNFYPAASSLNDFSLDPDKALILLARERELEALSRGRALSKLRGRLFLRQQDYRDAQNHDRQTLLGQTLGQWKRRLAESHARQARLAHVAKPFIFISQRFLLAKAFTHWQSSSVVGRESTALLHRHLVRLNCFGAWLSAAVAEQDALVEFPRRCFLKRWLNVLHRRHHDDVRADEIRRNRLLRTAFQTLLRETRLRQGGYELLRCRKELVLRRWHQRLHDVTATEHIPTAAITFYPRHRALAIWRSRTQSSTYLEDVAIAWRARRLLRSAFDCLKMEYNARGFFINTSWKFAERSLREWRLRTAALQVCRSSQQRLAHRAFSSLAQHVDGSNKELVVRANQFFGWHQKLAARFYLLHLRDRAMERRADNVRARRFRLTHLASRALSSMLSRTKHSAKLWEQASRADFYLCGLHALSSWRRATKTARENRLERDRIDRRERIRNAYLSIAIPNKRRLARSVFVSWLGRTRIILNNQSVSDRFAYSHVQANALRALQLWHAITANIAAQDRISTEFRDRRDATHAFLLLRAALARFRSLDAAAVSYRYSIDTAVAMTCLNRLEVRLFQLGSLNQTALRFFQRTLDRRDRALLRYWADLALQLRQDDGGDEDNGNIREYEGDDDLFRPGGPTPSIKNANSVNSRNPPPRFASSVSQPLSLGRSVIRPRPLDFRVSQFLPSVRESVSVANLNFSTHRLPFAVPTGEPPRQAAVSTAFSTNNLTTPLPAYLRTPSKRSVVRAQAMARHSYTSSRTHTDSAPAQAPAPQEGEVPETGRFYPHGRTETPWLPEQTGTASQFESTQGSSVTPPSPSPGPPSGLGSVPLPLASTTPAFPPPRPLSRQIPHRSVNARYPSQAPQAQVASPNPDKPDQFFSSNSPSASPSPAILPPSQSLSSLGTSDHPSAHPPPITPFRNRLREGYQLSNSTLAPISGSSSSLPSSSAPYFANDPATLGSRSGTITTPATERPAGRNTRGAKAWSRLLSRSTVRNPIQPQPFSENLTPTFRRRRSQSPPQSEPEAVFGGKGEEQEPLRRNVAFTDQ